MRVFMQKDENKMGYSWRMESTMRVFMQKDDNKMGYS